MANNTTDASGAAAGAGDGGGGRAAAARKHPNVLIKQVCAIFGMYYVKVMKVFGDYLS